MTKFVCVLSVRTVDDEGRLYDQTRAGIQNGFVLTNWCGDTECENAIKADCNATTRCMPFGADEPSRDYNWKEYYYCDYYLLNERKKKSSRLRLR